MIIYYVKSIEVEAFAQCDLILNVCDTGYICGPYFDDTTDFRCRCKYSTQEHPRIQLKKKI